MSESGLFLEIPSQSTPSKRSSCASEK